MCLEKNLQNADPNNAHTKEPEAPIKAQNLDEMLKLMEERDGNSCDPQPGEMEDLLDNRNKAWIEKMPSIMKETPTLFVVGAGHLPGTNGVLKLFQFFLPVLRQRDRKSVV